MVEINLIQWHVLNLKIKRKTRFGPKSFLGPLKLLRKIATLNFVEHSISQRSSLGTILNVHVFRESWRSHYRKVRINTYLWRTESWRNILMRFFFLLLFEIFVSSALEDRVPISEDQVLTNKDSILVLKFMIFLRPFLSLLFHVISIDVSFNSRVHYSSECSSSGWFLTWVD